MPNPDIAVLHSITSSARTKRAGGTSRPIAFAVFNLIAISNLTGACEGRPTDSAPFEIRSM
jgi:hypothetical protein